jgi:hypothetical protein
MTEAAGSTASLLALVVSCLALAVSALTAWLTLLRKGGLYMTQPTQIYFGPDGGFKAGEAPSKVYLRAMLYATGKRGWIIENMFARIQRGETRQNFNIWVHGANDQLRRGAGLFVPESGIVTNHHFVVPPDSSFDFISGNYVLDIFATEIGAKRARLLFSISLEITPAIYEKLRQPDHGLYFDWGPDSRRYLAHVKAPPRTEIPPFLKEIFAGSEPRGR